MASKSGTYKQPSLLKLPKPLSNSEYGGLRGVHCYVVDHYGDFGISCLVARDKQSDKIAISLGDWEGTTIDLNDQSHPMHGLIKKFLSTKAEPLYRLIVACGIPQAILYLIPTASGGFKLVDVRVSLNKFVGPGMLVDIFGKVIETQSVIHIGMLDDKMYESIAEGKGKFSGDVIIKPSRYRTIASNNEPIPLYVEFKR